MTFGEILRASPPVRRRNNGALYELTPAQKKKCDELIRKECFLHRDGNCLYLEDKEGPSPCAQMVSFHVWCRWFQNAILPLDWKLESEVFSDRHTKKCSRCGRGYLSNARNNKYCPDCSKEVRKENWRKYTEKYRRKKEGMSAF